jgi:TRAP-type mannitol/chloroaromatic compound transport system permease large subunit
MRGFTLPHRAVTTTSSITRKEPKDMSILQPKSKSAVWHRSTGPLPANSNDAVFRATGVLSLLAIGTIHFLQIVPTTEATPLLGVSFLILIAASLAVAGRLATRTDHRTWMASAVVCAAAIGGYVFTRTFSTPLDNQDVGNWSCMLGLAALFVETTLLAFSAYAALVQSALLTAVRPARPGTESARIVPGTSRAA